MTADAAVEPVGGSLLERARALVPLLRAHAAESEAGRRLARPVVEALGAAGIYRMNVPRSLGGLELDPLTSMRVIEELARGDGSAAWCAMIASSSAGFVAGFLAEPTARALFARAPGPAVGTVFTPSGIATEEPGGYRLSGRWRYASFCEDCDWMALHTTVRTGDELARHADGALRMPVLVVAREDFAVEDTWRTLGMRATASHDIVIDARAVPRERAFHPHDDRPRAPGPFYAYTGLVLTTLASVPLALAREAIDLMSERARAASAAARALMQPELARAEADVRAARALLHDAVGELWRGLEAGSPPSLALRAHYRLALTNGHGAAARAVDRMAEIAGGSAIHEADPLARIVRDVRTAVTHGSASARTYHEIGGMLLGVDRPRTML
jgi:alkylation response protein AidB-like acyl-CoA dehydrogenase